MASSALSESPSVKSATLGSLPSRLRSPTACSDRAITIIAGLGLFDSGHMAWALDNGAAGRSPLRHKAARQPETDAKIKVNPPPLQTLDTSTGAMVGTALSGRASQSFWHAQDAALSAGQGVAVVEAFELSF